MNEQVEALLRTLPRKIKVGAYDWRVKVIEGSEGDNNGEADFSNHTVNLYVDGHVDPVHTTGVVLHELLHVIFEDQGLETPETDYEEQIIQGFEKGLISLYRDNPKLLTWIKKGLK